MSVVLQPQIQSTSDRVVLQNAFNEKNLHTSGPIQFKGQMSAEYSTLPFHPMVAQRHSINNFLPELQVESGAPITFTLFLTTI